MRYDFKDGPFWDEESLDEKLISNMPQLELDHNPLFTNSLETVESSDAPSILQTLRARLGLRSPYRSRERSVDLLLFDLTSSEWATRVEAVRELEELGSQAPVDALLSALKKDESKFVRAAAARAIGGLGERTAAYKTDLIRAFHDHEWNVRTSVIQVLGKLGKQVPVEILVMALEDEDESVRAAAVCALGKLGKQVPLEPLLLALKDEDVSVRMAAIGVLGDLDRSVPITPIALALKDENPSVRAEAAWALEKLKGRVPEQTTVEFLVYALGDDDAIVRATAAWALGELGEKAPLEPLIRALRDKDASVRTAAASGLQGRVSLETLRPILGHEEDAGPRTAFQGCGRPDEKPAIGLLLSSLESFLRSKKGKVYPEVLGTLDNRTLVLKCCYEGEGSSLHDTILRNSGSIISVEPLAAALADMDDIVRKVALQVFGELGALPYTECFMISLDHLQGVTGPITGDIPAKVILAGIGYSPPKGAGLSRSQAAEISFDSNEHSLFMQLIAEWTVRTKESLCEYLQKLTEIKLWYNSSSEFIPPGFVDAQSWSNYHKHPSQ